MTQKNKQLLLKDLCARLPYGVIAYASEINKNGTITDVNIPYNMVNLTVDNASAKYELVPLFDIKPYLRPISNMSEEECNKLFEILKINEESGKEWIKINDIGIIRLFTEVGKDFYEIAKAMDYLYSIYVDFRNLIEKGLALEAPEGMYKIG